MLNSGNDVIRILSRSAVAGIGFSGGRDIYRTMKKQWLLILAVCIFIAGPFYLARLASQGHDVRSPAESLRKVWLPAGAVGILLAVMSWAALAAAPRPGDVAWANVLLVVTLASTGVGFLWGLARRGKRLHGFEIARANERFLLDNGILALGGRNDALRDAAGTELVLDDRRANEIVLKVVGRRGKRAFITHDDEGRFVQYVPAQGI